MVQLQIFTSDLKKKLLPLIILVTKFTEKSYLIVLNTAKLQNSRDGS